MLNIIKANVKRHGAANGEPTWLASWHLVSQILQMDTWCSAHVGERDDGLSTIFGISGVLSVADILVKMGARCDLRIVNK